MNPKAQAPSPQRATTSFTLSCLLLNIPVSAYTGTEEVRVARKEFVKNAEGRWVSVGRVPTNKETGDVIDRSIVVRRAESTSGVWVDLDDDEIAEVTMPKGQAEVETFIATRNLGQYVTEGLYQIRPRRVKGKTDPTAQRALCLLFDTMKRRKVAALVKVAMRGPARYALLDYDGNMRFVVTADAIREPIDLPVVALTTQERDLCLTLIEKIGLSTPILVDTAAQAIQAFVDGKAAGVEPEVVVEAAPTSDLLAGLMASIEADLPRGKQEGAA